MYQRLKMATRPDGRFEASTNPEIVVTSTRKIVLRSIGDERAPVIMTVWIADRDGTGQALFFRTRDSTAPTERPLGLLAVNLASSRRMTVVFANGWRTPMFAVKSVDLSAGTAVIILDRDASWIADE